MVKHEIRVGALSYAHVSAFFGKRATHGRRYICIDVHDDSPCTELRGKRLLCAHREADGEFALDEEDLMHYLKITGSDYILCCYPGIAPTDLPVFGNWKGVTGLFSISLAPMGDKELIGTLKIVGYMSKDPAHRPKPPRSPSSGRVRVG